ncbi:polysaccharide deacetylase family sporulation protein PdaB [Clostridium fermenticellae]|uniref:Polysaccharide deacetylase family sporulation protein PdaB n=1 Tax=Clostridium fermenticellae TaxID=2068654 RepID=A0A386H6N1_9CLOT|nr:polysaccharide deacetylase family sporulation protein PdaB [Clostridium fermenticellae]AYD41417.1 polysaccharide deacetylase family sporulation protein PdaB [Clostridium fermenticellae]
MLTIAICVSMLVNRRNTGVFINTNRKLPIYSVDTQEKKVAITFDVSLGNDNMDEILDTLDKYDIKATFFLVGEWTDSHSDEVKELYKRGHEIGNHSDKHPDMTKLSKDEIIEDININDAKIRNLIGTSTKLFRCPSGSYNNSVIQTVENAGWYCIQWDADSIDWKDQGMELEYNRIMKNVKPGSILLFHTTAKYTPQNLPRIIENLKKEGYKFVKVGDLIYKTNYHIDYSGRQIQN